jgi:hypothetical protein
MFTYPLRTTVSSLPLVPWYVYVAAYCDVPLMGPYVNPAERPVPLFVSVEALVLLAITALTVRASPAWFQSTRSPPLAAAVSVPSPAAAPIVRADCAEAIMTPPVRKVVPEPRAIVAEVVVAWRSVFTLVVAAERAMLPPEPASFRRTLEVDPLAIEVPDAAMLVYEPEARVTTVLPESDAQPPSANDAHVATL